MAEYRKYSIKRNRFRRAFLQGMTVEGESELRCEENVPHRIFVTDCIDGIEEEALWGHLHCDWSMDEEMVVTVCAVATDQKYIRDGERQIELSEIFKDPDIPPEKKHRFMEQLDAVKAVNMKDVLLYQLKGRYLYLSIEVQGVGNGKISRIFVDNQGDLLMDTFPEIYREYGSFFHRYLSIYSSLYLEFQEQIENVAGLIDVDTAPAALLPVFGRWMGLDVSGDFLSEGRLRNLIKEAYALNRIKGTKDALARVCEIVLGEKVIILEKNVLRDNIQTVDEELYTDLYGEGTYDVTILVQTFVPEDQKSQLLFLLNQFKPVRSNLKIRFLEKKDNLDGHAYLDMNACVTESQSGILDERIGLDDQVLLLE